MKTPEALVKDDVKKYIKSMQHSGEHVYAFWPVQMGYGARTLDALICYRGRFGGLEIKADKGKPAKPDPHQACIMEEMARADGRVLCTNSLREFIDWLRQF